MTYTIKYRNDGPSQKDVVIDDYLDQNVDFDPPIHLTPPWHVGDLGPGENGTISFKVKLKKGNFNSIINTYKISSDEIKGINATLTTPVVHSLWINKTADKKAYNRDENITYTIRYGNSQSNQNAININITDISRKLTSWESARPPVLSTATSSHGESRS